MSDKELIKKAIERIIELLEPLECEYNNGSIDAYKGILRFIDLLPEESESKDRINECPHWEKHWGCETSPMNNCDSCPQAKWVEMKEENENYNERYKRIAQTEQFKESYCGKSLGKEESESEDLDRLVISLEETIGTSPHSREVIKEHLQKAAEWGRNHFEDKSEKVSEDLDEEIENHIKDSLAIKFPTTDKEQIKADIRYIAHHFAEWQKQKDEKLFKEDSWNYIEEYYPDITKEEKLRLYDVSIKSRLAGANTIKQKMAKDVFIDDYIVHDGRIELEGDPLPSVDPIILLPYPNFKPNDKVKIIIVKEEQK